MKILKRISNTINCIGVWGGIRYRFALELKKRNIPLLRNKRWKFQSRKRGFDFYIRPFDADIFLIRAMILGCAMDGVGEYDVVSMDKNFRDTNDKLAIIDLGANIGIFSLIIAAKYPNAEIYAIEPDKDNFELLSLNLKKYPNVHCINVGIWNKECNLRVINPGCGSMSFRFEETEGDGTHALSIESIMDRFGIDHIDILKMDIEGSEKAVFEKNTDWCQMVRYYIIETHDRYVDGCTEMIDNILRGELGYKYDKHEENHIYYK